jgi:hypothetical protein
LTLALGAVRAFEADADRAPDPIPSRAPPKEWNCPSAIVVWAAAVPPADLPFELPAEFPAAVPLPDLPMAPLDDLPAVPARLLDPNECQPGEVSWEAPRLSNDQGLDWEELRPDVDAPRVPP